MKYVKSIVGVALLGAALGFSNGPAQAAEGVLMKTEITPGYCHMQFPAIEDRNDNGGGYLNPMLQSRNTTDVVDFYGPCDYDPTGKTEVQNQKIDRFLTTDDEGD